MSLLPVVLAALVAGTPHPAPPEIAIPGTTLKLGTPRERVDSLAAFRAGAASANQRSGSVRFFGLSSDAVLEFDAGRTARARFNVADASPHSRDYVDDQLRRMGLRRECLALNDRSHDCVWTGRVVMHVSWQPGTLSAEVEVAPEPPPASEPPHAVAPAEARPGETTGTAAMPGEPPMLPDTLTLPAPGGPGARPAPLGPLPVLVFPAAAMRAGVQGVVRVLATVDTTGSVVDVVLIHGIRELDEAALEAARRYRFVPLEAAGRRVRFRVVIPFTFTLH